MKRNKASMDTGTPGVAVRVEGGEESGEQQIVGEQESRVFFSREHLLQWIPFLCIILIGAMLRFIGLGDKPLHHDESLHAFFSLQLPHNITQWQACFQEKIVCYRYDPLLHGPFQFHAIALIYKICCLLGAPDHGINTTTVRIAAATLGSLLVGLPYFLRDYLGGRLTALLACFLLAISPCMVYYSRFAREDIYMAFFTLLLVVATGRYVRERKASWFVLAALGLTFSYATKEATFLSTAVFGSFLLAVLVWELGSKIQVRAKIQAHSALECSLPETGSTLALIAFFLLCAPVLRWLFNWMKNASAFTWQHPAASQVFIENLKERTMIVLPWLAIAAMLIFCGLWIRDWRRRWKGLPVHTEAQSIVPTSNPLLHTLRTIPWQHWASALLAAAFVFVLLFSVLFTNLQHGVADGIWEGLYYWFQQQHVARGGQPWYYYLLVLPLYEQLGLFFCIIGIIRCIVSPSYFRLFLVYWFLGNVAIYSWASEKMPWLTIHMVVPLLLLAAIGLEPIVRGVYCEFKERVVARGKGHIAVKTVSAVSSRGVTFGGALCAIFLLVLTVQNMYQVTYIHYADAPHEMLIYVQTSQDINIVMNKIALLDQKLDGGQHKLAIGVMLDVEWPFYWYLRDYTNVCYGFPTGCVDANPAVILAGGDNNLAQYQKQYGGDQGTDEQAHGASSYRFHQYHLRTWWDEGYKPPACIETLQNHNCQGQSLVWGGVGPLLWLSYGDTPPADAQFDPGLAMKHIWNWWWLRQAFGNTTGSTDMGLFIRGDLGVNP